MLAHGTSPLLVGPVASRNRTMRTALEHTSEGTTATRSELLPVLTGVGGKNDAGQRCRTGGAQASALGKPATRVAGSHARDAGRRACL